MKLSFNKNRSMFSILLIAIMLREICTSITSNDSLKNDVQKEKRKLNDINTFVCQSFFIIGGDKDNDGYIKEHIMPLKNMFDSNNTFCAKFEEYIDLIKFGEGEGFTNKKYKIFIMTRNFIYQNIIKYYFKDMDIRYIQVSIIYLMSAFNDINEYAGNDVFLLTSYFIIKLFNANLIKYNENEASFKCNMESLIQFIEEILKKLKDNKNDKHKIREIINESYTIYINKKISISDDNSINTQDVISHIDYDKDIIKEEDFYLPIYDVAKTIINNFLSAFNELKHDYPIIFLFYENDDKKSANFLNCVFNPSVTRNVHKFYIKLFNNALMGIYAENYEDIYKNAFFYDYPTNYSNQDSEYNIDSCGIISKWYNNENRDINSLENKESVKKFLFCYMSLYEYYDPDVDEDSKILYEFLKTYKNKYDINFDIEKHAISPVVNIITKTDSNEKSNISCASEDDSNKIPAASLAVDDNYAMPMKNWNSNLNESITENSYELSTNENAFSNSLNDQNHNMMGDQTEDLAEPIEGKSSALPSVCEKDKMVNTKPSSIIKNDVEVNEIRVKINNVILNTSKSMVVLSAILKCMFFG
ncbi:hypothetical protein TCON_2518 [Astathelohania contejeani]|uniref:Uncharacterized protein n=1 Tax=Astathelohania contejeani TaxID=164912 RepID=A0ABQ7HVS0_9MICR|nr:hypothetical protein TCON_2518 [Thelohania contejeani]